MGKPHALEKEPVGSFFFGSGFRHGTGAEGYQLHNLFCVSICHCQVQLVIYATTARLPPILNSSGSLVGLSHVPDRLGNQFRQYRAINVVEGFDVQA